MICVLVPEDQLVPGRRVLARALTNMKFYDPGYIYMALENMIGVHFDGGPPWAYDPNDITAMMVDKDPDPHALVVGTPVVAKRSNDSSHVEGKVKERKEENGKETYLIDFLDGIGQWDTLDQIRILTTSKPGGMKFEELWLIIPAMLHVCCQHRFTLVQLCWLGKLRN